MGRPLKKGLEYFQVDVHMDADDKIALIDMELGTEGFGALMKILMHIYASDYYHEWSDRELMLFCRAHHVEMHLCRKTVEAALKYEVFNPVLFEEYGVLTSRGIQARYFFGAKGRIVEVRRELLLLDPAEIIPAENLRFADEKRGVSDEETPENEGEIPEKSDETVSAEYGEFLDEKRGVSDGETLENEGETPYIIVQDKIKQDSTLNAREVSVRIPDADSLEIQIYRLMEAEHGALFARQVEQINACCQIVHMARIRGDPETVAMGMIAAFKRLKERDRKFYAKKPFSPKMLVALWDNIWEEAKAEVVTNRKSEHAKSAVMAMMQESDDAN